MQQETSHNSFKRFFSIRVNVSSGIDFCASLPYLLGSAENGECCVFWALDDHISRVVLGRIYAWIYPTIFGHNSNISLCEYACLW